VPAPEDHSVSSSISTGHCIHADRKTAISLGASAATRFCRAAVLGVVRVGHIPQVADPVVQLVPIDMVDAQQWQGASRQTPNKPMQVDCLSFDGRLHIAGGCQHPLVLQYLPRKVIIHLKLRDHPPRLSLPLWNNHACLLMCRSQVLQPHPQNPESSSAWQSACH